MQPIPKSRRRVLFDLLVIAAFVALSAWAAVRWVRPLHAAEEWLSDFRVSVFSPVEPQHPDILIVTITEETLRNFPYRSPLQRGFLALLLDYLDGAGVRAVGLDILFDQPTEPDYDETLRQAILGFSHPIVVGFGDERAGLSEWQLEFEAGYLEGVTTGLVNVLKDDDGIVRWAYAGDPGATGRPSFAYALARAIGVTVPEEEVRLVYRGTRPGEPAFASQQAQLVALGVLPAEWFAGKIVFVGADLGGDRHRTPLGRGRPGERTMPGVSIHATALAQLLDDRRFPESSSWVVLALLVALVALGVGIASWDCPLWLKAVLGLLILGALAASGCLAFARGRAMIPLFLPGLAHLGSFLASSVYVARQRGSSERYIRRAFGRYLSPKVIEELVADPRRLELGGEKRDMSFVFSDIAGFTTLSERIPAEELIPLLQGYLDGMVEVALRHDGTVDKFIGDAVVVFFGAPAAQGDHARRAVACALDMDRFAERFRSEREGQGIPFGRTRIGVHSGPATVGNIGGASRFDYTAIGDTVNTAARLESVNKHLGTRVCISAAAASKSEGALLRPAGALVLKGKHEAIEVFSPGGAGEASDEEYGRAFEALRGPADEALDIFRKLHAEYPEDGLIAFHLGRLEHGERGVRIVMEEK